MSYTYALALLLSLGGNLLIARRRRSGWVLWVVANLLWLRLNLHAADFDPDLYYQAALFTAYTFIALYGWWSWRPPRRSLY